MAKYIDAEKLKVLLSDLKENHKHYKGDFHEGVVFTVDELEEDIDSLQQDETQVDKMLCSQVWWEEQGWIMIPPDATIEGIDSLLREVKKKLQQEQPELSNEFEIAINRRLNLINGENLTATELLEETKGMAAELLDLACKVIEKEQPEVDLEKFTEKIKTFQRRYKYPEIVSIKDALLDWIKTQLAENAEWREVNPDDRFFGGKRSSVQSHN